MIPCRISPTNYLLLYLEDQLKWALILILSSTHLILLKADLGVSIRHQQETVYLQRTSFSISFSRSRQVKEVHRPCSSQS